MKKAAVIATVLSASLVSSIGLSWACTRQSTILALSPQFGQPGSPVVVEGMASPALSDEGVATKGSVEIRWNSTQGPKLAEAVADDWGRFAVSVQIPSVAPDVYFLIAVDSEGTVARHAFSVTGSPTAEGRSGGTGSVGGRTNPSQDLWTGFSESNNGASSIQGTTPNPETRPIHPAGVGLFALGLAAASAVGTLAVANRRRLQTISSTRKG